MGPREKALERGVSSLSDSELISIIIGFGCKGHSYKSISGYIAGYIKGKYRETLSQLSIDDLSRIRGVGQSKALKIVSAIELGLRLQNKERAAKTKLITRRDVANFFAYVGEYKQEHFIVALVNARYELIAKRKIGIGKLDRVNVSIRDVMRFALENNSYGIILVHNHPSGDPGPSKQDIEVTDRIRNACKIMDVILIDHVIVSSNGWYGIDL